MKMKNVGVVGFSGRKFDEKLAESILNALFDSVELLYTDCEFALVSGLTNVGVPAIAYKLAAKRKWHTVGVACSKAEEYDCFDVDDKIIVGDEWGDESETFLDKIDLMIRVGGGEQSMAEAKEADKRGLAVLAVDLPEIKE